jgi:hypothetical protein
MKCEGVFDLLECWKGMEIKENKYKKDTTILKYSCLVCAKEQ